MNANRLQVKRNLMKLLISWKSRLVFCSVATTDQSVQWIGYGMDVGGIVLCFPAEEVFISPKIPNCSPHSLLFKGLPGILHPVARRLWC